jgi:hypothetical protein
MDPEMHERPMYLATLAWTLVIGLALATCIFLVREALGDERKVAPPTPAECSALRSAIEQFGEALVLSAASERGLTQADIAAIRRACTKEIKR